MKYMSVNILDPGQKEILSRVSKKQRELIVWRALQAAIPKAWCKQILEAGSVPKSTSGSGVPARRLGKQGLPKGRAPQSGFVTRAPAAVEKMPTGEKKKADLSFMGEFALQSGS